MSTDTKFDTNRKSLNPAELQAAEHFPEAQQSNRVDQDDTSGNNQKNSGDTDDYSDPSGYSSDASKKNNSRATEDSGKSKNIADVNSREGASSTHKNSFTGGPNKQTGIKGMIPIVKKKGPFGLIILTLLLGGGAFSFLSLSILPVQFKEAFFGDLNDQLAAMDLRTDHMLKSKLKGLSPAASSCGTVKIRCKFTTMSNSQYKKFQRAGFDMKTEKTTLGRHKVTEMTFKNGDKVTKITSPSQLIDLANNDSSVRSALRRAYNPKYAGYSDKLAKLKLENYKTNKAKKIIGNTDEERNKSVDNATAGDKAFNGLTDKSKAVQEDSKGKYYIDNNGNRIDAEIADPKNPGKKIANPDFASNASSGGKVGTINDLAKTTGSSVGGVAKSLGKGLSLTGALDTACTVYNTARAVAAAAKVTRAIQLIQFAMVFFNFADSLKAGDATDQESNFVNKKLTETDNRAKIVNENSLSAPDANGNVAVTEVDNPSYNKNALDSDGYKIAAYNEAPFPIARTLQFAIGGGLVGGLASVLNTVSKTLNLGLADSPKQARKNIRDTCKTVQSWWARTVGLIAGVVSAIGSFGLSTALSIGASVAIGFALPFLEAALADIVAGKVVSSATANTDIGDATFGGAGALMGGIAQARGMEPGNAGEIKSYIAVTNDIKAKNIAMETYDAKDKPFDIQNQYSFLGSFARKINPTLVKSQTNVASALTSIPTFIGSAFSSIIPQAKATSIYNPERFNKCGDDGYDDVGIDADVMCNPRYVMGGTELGMDTETALNYMIDNKQIKEDDGAPVPGSAYADWVDNCPDRKDGWGESSDADSNNSDLALGIACKTDGTVATNLPTMKIASSTGVVTAQAGSNSAGPYAFFRVYHMDNGIADGMEDEETGPATVSGAATTQPSTDQPPNTQISNGGPGWDLIDGQDYSGTACAAGTEDVGVQKHPTKGFTIRLCKINGATVSSLISLNVKALFEAATAAGLSLSADSSYRSYDEQIATRAANGCNSGGGCSVPTATPGTSQHERGLALDFSQDGSLLSSSASGFSWLQQNAAKYGLLNLPSEAWHWSSDAS